MPCARNGSLGWSCFAPVRCRFLQWPMPSSIDSGPSEQGPNSRRAWARVEHWNRKLHFYAGLFLLFFLWLFAVSGLVLNHPTWRFTEFWTSRAQTQYERDIILP